MRHFIGLLIAVAVMSTSQVAFPQGVMFPEPHPRMPFPRPVPGPHPLKVRSLHVETTIQGQVATTRVTQVFLNDLNFVVDGVYFYPLPEDATFVEFATWDGDKKLTGEILEREEARNRYLAIVRRSWDPGLLEYAGVNLFQARVFPVPAQGEKKVEFAYSQILKADHGLVSYVYPLQSGTSANPQAVGDLTVSVDVRAGQGIKTIYSPTHTVDVQRDGGRHARLSFEKKNVLPDRNFQLFYSLSNADFGLSLVTYREGADDGYFMILFAPGMEPASSAAIPKDILFVLDTSGSMQERGKLDKALSALKFGVQSLRPGDRFNMVTFSTDSRKFRENLLPATTEAKDAAIRFIERQSASGGTDINDALKDALGSFADGDRPRYAVFITDGLPTVGETDPGKILREASAGNTGKTRIFTFGVGYDVNTFLLDQLAARNYGAADYVAPDEDLEVKLSNFFAKLSSPVMTGIDVDWGNLRVFDVYPRQLPDLFRGSQLTILGRYSGTGTIPLDVRGTVRGERRTLKYEQNEFPSVNTANDFLPRLWAMRKVGYLLEQIRMSGENAEVKNEIVRLAKKYGFVTPYTSYLAADDKDLITGAPPSPQLMNLQMSPDVPARNAGVSAGSMTPAREAVAASVALKSMKNADVVQPRQTKTTRRIGSKEFVLREGVWTDSAYDPAGKLPTLDLVYGSEPMLKAVAGDRKLASYASLGKNVVVVHNGKVYRIHV